ncbi:carbamoyltransferase [Vulcanimicrobium alpinum]|uniref:Carbamoyltransferase n=1 Tax=Vulcanimicrobium alpinum TaxID=3016050 RepID=A0AAN2C9X6_UNVUL|nr:carbamoyltransferase HypF [Vulcanimicrobium alpinum]BDE06506.1 carbamoyltransferase [Vulcanimicrobium alpinum]
MAARSAVDVCITGVVQGVGFRPFVFRAAQAHGIAGWVLNDDGGVRLRAEGPPDLLDAFLAALQAAPPPAARIVSFASSAAAPQGLATFEIRASAMRARPTARVSPDLPICAACLRDLADPADRRHGYPYVNCTDCGPRYSIVLSLPYDRPRTTMRSWPMCEACRREYDDPGDRRFHAQPTACTACGPRYRLELADGRVAADDPVDAAAALLRDGAIVAVKGIGGYHLGCDARDAGAVCALRERKFRKERPFAIMARDLDAARELVILDASAETLLRAIERPIVLAPMRERLAGVAPDNDELGVMLPYAPLHHLLFAAGAPRALVMTSANRSSEPIAYRNADARTALAGIADAFLIGERPIARRIDDSIVRAGAAGPVVLRRARGYAPRAVATFPDATPILAVGGDLKNAIALIVGGQAFVSQHIGDLDHAPTRAAFAATIDDLCAMYGVERSGLTVAHDLHPEYYAAEYARALGGRAVAIQHHRAHIASVLAERAAWDEDVVGFAFDGTGYGDDGTIWGGEVFAGSLRSGLARVTHLRAMTLPGGDAAARYPVQAAAGALAGIADDIAFDQAPFAFPPRFAQARAVARSGLRAYSTSSIGRLFDAVAALCGFTREQTFEGQAAMWLEHLARRSPAVPAYAFALRGGTFDGEPVLRAIVADRLAGRDPGAIARAFHGAVAAAVVDLAEALDARRVVASGGVFQNALLTSALVEAFGDRLWLNRDVPPNDGGLALGQAALAHAAQSGT